MSPRAALVLTSLIFGLAHIHRKTGIYDFPNWPYVACATFAGLFYGYTYQKTRSLMSASLVHALIDSTYRIFLRGAV